MKISIFLRAVLIFFFPLLFIQPMLFIVEYFPYLKVHHVDLFSLLFHATELEISSWKKSLSYFLYTYTFAEVHNGKKIFILMTMIHARNTVSIRMKFSTGGEISGYNHSSSLLCLLIQLQWPRATITVLIGCELLRHIWSDRQLIHGELSNFLFSLEGWTTALRVNFYAYIHN